MNQQSPGTVTVAFRLFQRLPGIRASDIRRFADQLEAVPRICVFGLDGVEDLLHERQIRCLGIDDEAAVSFIAGRVRIRTVPFGKRHQNGGDEEE